MFVKQVLNILTIAMMILDEVLYQAAYPLMVQHTVVEQIPSCATWNSSDHHQHHHHHSHHDSHHHHLYHHHNIFIIFIIVIIIVIIIVTIIVKSSRSEWVGQDYWTHFPHSIDRHNQHTTPLPHHQHCQHRQHRHCHDHGLRDSAYALYWIQAE